MFHHDPNRTDAELQELELFYQGKLRGKTDDGRSRWPARGGSLPSSLTAEAAMADSEAR